MTDASVQQPPDTGQRAAYYLSLLAGKGFPVYVVEELAMFIAHGYPVGDFVRAVLENDLAGAVNKADQESAACLVRLIGWLNDYAPHSCWGSEARVAVWMVQRQAEQRKTS